MKLFQSIPLILVVIACSQTPRIPASSTSSPNPRNWGLERMQVKEAWDLALQTNPTVVAVVDTGIDPTHPGLRDKLWHEGDNYGWDFVNGRPNPIDYHGHGTHIAGIIAGKNEDALGFGGVAKNAQIMPVKFFSETISGIENLKNTVSAIRYAINHEAKVINYSGGGATFFEEEYLAMKSAEAHGIVFVAAAGNERRNSDLEQNFYFPCSYHLSNIICVASTTQSDQLASTSNWGPKFTDVAAPGENIFSSLRNQSYGLMSGTSQATAFVSGLAALLLSENPKLTAVQVKALIVDSSDRVPQLKGRVRGGRVNARKAVSLLKQRFTIRRNQD